MSFYANPYHRRQAQAYGYPYATGPAVSPAPSFNFYAAPPAHPRAASYYDDIDAEEQAALAHLHAIQQRREAAQLAARREAALQAQIAAQREAAYAAAVERERAREEAMRHLIAEKQRRQEAAASAQAIALERQRRAQAVAAQRQAHALAAQHALAQRAIEEEKRADEYLKRRNACARRCAGGCAKKEDKKEQKDEWKQVNDILASLFGINLVEEEETVKEDKKEEPVQEETAAPEPTADNKAEQKTEAVEEKAAATAAPAAPAQSADNTKPAETKSEPASFDLNDLLSTFLGVSLEPAKEGDKPTEGADKLTAKLNDFLSQFGLEFEPSCNTAESSSSAAKPAPAKADTPARAPTPAPVPTPVEGKGKGVADGEKPVRPTESTQPAQADQPADEPISKASALDKLRDISHELHLATESFTFPSKLAFADTTNSDATPALLFNKGNSGYHAQAHKLLQLLLAADGVSSGGDREVRKQRKAIVKAIEGAIEQLEQKRDAIWAEVKEKREQGAESSDDEGSVSSWNSTESEHVEHANDESEAQNEEVKEAETEKPEEDQKPEEKKEDQTYAEAAAPAEEANKEEVEGFEVPTQEKPVEDGAKTQEADATVKIQGKNENETQEEKKASSKEDDFELL